MSQQKKKTGSRKTTGSQAKKKAAVKKSTVTARRSSDMPAKASSVRKMPDLSSPEDTANGSEIVLIIMAAFCLLLLLGNLNLAGSLGRCLRQFQLGLFGSLGYILPIYLIWVGCFIYINVKKFPGNTMLKAAASLLTLISVCGLAELLGGRNLGMDMTLAECYAMGGEGLNGGWFGGLFNLELYPAFGVLGTYVVLIFITIIGLVITTGKSVMQPLKRHSSVFMEDARIRSEQRREERELLREEEAIRREEAALAREERRRELEVRRSEVRARSLAFGSDTLLTGEDEAPAARKSAAAEKAQEEKKTRRRKVTAEEIFAEDPISDNENDRAEFMPRKVLSTNKELDAFERGEKLEDPFVSGKDIALDAPLKDKAGTKSSSRSRRRSEPVIHLGGQQEETFAVSPPTLETSADAAPHYDSDLGPSAITFSGLSCGRAKEPAACKMADTLIVDDKASMPVHETLEPEGMTEDRSARNSEASYNVKSAIAADPLSDVKHDLASDKASQEEAAGKICDEYTASSPKETNFAGETGSGTEKTLSAGLDAEIDRNFSAPEDRIEFSAVDPFDAFDQPDTFEEKTSAAAADLQESGGDVEDDMSAYDEFDGMPADWQLKMNNIDVGGGKDEKSGNKAAQSKSSSPAAGPKNSSSGSDKGDIWRSGGPGDGNSGMTFRGPEIKAKEEVKPVKKIYRLPATDLLAPPQAAGQTSRDMLLDTAHRLEETLENFGVGVKVTDVSRGPSVTRYELHPDQGVKVSRIVALQDDIKLNLAVSDVRIEAPIPGKAAVGIEVPNEKSDMVALAEILESKEFVKSGSKISFGVGKGISGNVVVSDLARMPHVLIAGATGSGKSVMINTIIMSILFKATPDDVKFIMIDPKMVELSVYNGIPHLLLPVVTDPKRAANALQWAVNEMADRYKKFADQGVRDIKGYNKKIMDEGEEKKLPQIVVIVDEMADLMMVSASEVEEAICRLAQLARAAGIHLVLATQRPSVNVITGLIKANVQSRIAFSVSSGTDSRTILDMNGAEKLLGKGDMLFYPSNFPKPVRIQGAFVSDEEVERVVDFWKYQNDNPGAPSPVERQIAESDKDGGTVGAGERDELFADAGRFIIDKEKASIGNLQRVFRIGFNRAARIMDQLADLGVVGPDEGTKAREILMSAEEFEDLLARL